MFPYKTLPMFLTSPVLYLLHFGCPITCQRQYASQTPSYLPNLCCHDQTEVDTFQSISFSNFGEVL